MKNWNRSVLILAEINKITLFILLLLLIPKSTLGVEIIQSPGESIWVEQGKDKSLVCTTNQRWEWCYWEHNNLQNEKTKYQTVQEYTTLQTGDPHITFTQLSETTCGIQILDAHPVEHQVKRL